MIKSRVKALVIILVSLAFAYTVWIVHDIYDGGVAGQNGSALGQLGADIRISIEAQYAKDHTYPADLKNLSVPFGDGSTPEDLKKAVYITEGTSAVVILSRPRGPSVLLVFKEAKCSDTKWLGY